MKRVLVVGFGFISGYFFNKNRDEFDFDIVTARSDLNDLGNVNIYSTIEELVHEDLNYDVVLIASYKNNFNENNILIKNIYNNLNPNLVIYMGSASIYEIGDGVISESTKFAGFNVLYANIKKKLDGCVKRYSESTGIPTIIINPTVVTGMGGAWYKNINEQLRYGEIRLPNKGESRISIISISNLSLVLKLIIGSQKEFTGYYEYIAAGDITPSWFEIYSAHALAKNCQMPKIENIGSSNLFNDNDIKDTVLKYVFKMPYLIQYYINKFRGLLVGAKRVDEASHNLNDKNLKPFQINGYYRYFMSQNVLYNNSKLKTDFKISDSDFESEIL